jgi:hypothetical protein
VPDAVRTAAFQIANVGDVLPTPVHVDGKVYVVRLAVKMPALDRTLEESERSIRVKLSQDKVRAKEDELLTQLRAKFPVQIDDGVVATVKVDLVDAGGAAPGDAASD